jgi:hypothetical protein
MRPLGFRLGLVLSMVVCVTALSGCVATSPDIQNATAQRLQSGVVAVADSSSGGDFTGALGQLVTLQNALAAATSAGTVSATRSVQIQAAIDVVREDLQAKLAPVPTVIPSPSPTVTPGDPATPGGGGSGDQGKGDKGGKGHK